MNTSDTKPMTDERLKQMREWISVGLWREFTHKECHELIADVDRLRKELKEWQTPQPSHPRFKDLCGRCGRLLEGSGDE